MSDQNSTQPKNNPIAILLMVLALVIVAGGAYFFINAKKDDATLVAEGTEQPAGDVSESDIPSEVTPAEEVPAAAEEPSEPVKLNLAEIMAPRTLGEANAPIKIVEYASLTCSHCAHFHNDVFPELKSKYIDTGKVQFEFREFPLNDPALKAAIAARCLPQERYESFISLLFKSQDHWAEGLDYMAALKQNAKLAGLSEAKFDACMNEPQIKVKIAERMQDAQDKWKVSSTPTFVINDGAEVVPGAAKLEDLERVFRKITNNAVGEAPAVE